METLHVTPHGKVYEVARDAVTGQSKAIETHYSEEDVETLVRNGHWMEMGRAPT